MIEYAFNNYERLNLEEKIKEEFENWRQINKNRIYINKAKDNDIILELEEIKRKAIPIKKDEERDLSFEINVIYNFEAPIEKGTKIGNIIAKKKDDIIEIVDIKINNRIEKKNILSYFTELLTFYNNFNIIDMRL